MPTAHWLVWGQQNSPKPAPPASPSRRTVTVVHFRSPQAIFYYLGSESVLNKTTYYKYSDELPPKPHECHEYDEKTPPYRKAWCYKYRAPFFIQTAEEFEARRATLSPECAAQYQPEIEITYRGRKYYVTNAQCARDPTTVTLQILGDLLNLHRDASEIPTTKTVITQ